MPLTNLADMLQNLPTKDQWSIFRTKITDDGMHIASAIHASNATTAKDDSFKDSHGTSAFAIMGTNLAINALLASMPYRTSAFTIMGM
jgi:hypothetical protein